MMTRRRMLAAGCLAGVLVLAACGSDNSSGSSTTTAGGGATTSAASSNTSVADAKALVERFSKDVTSVGVTEATSKRPPTGKKVVFMECPVPTCKTFGDGIEEATKLLGWTLTRLTYQLTPEGQQSAFQQAVDLKPDAIMSSGQDPATTLQQRKAAKDAGIPFFDNSAVYEADAKTATGKVDGDPAPPTVLLEPAGYVAFQNGELPAAWAIAQTDGNVHSVFVNVPDFPIIVPPQESYNAALKKACPDTCTNVNLAATVDQIGTTLPGKVVSAVQEHPDTNYVVFTSGDFSLGVAAALKAAGFDKIKLIGGTPIQANVESMKAGGTDEAWVGTSNIVIGWRLVDGAVRYFNGDKIASPVAMSADDTSVAAWPVTRIYTSKTAPATSEFVAPTDYKDIFSKLWKLS
jgi:ribose transport system substrate-binding protein